MKRKGNEAHTPTYKVVYKTSIPNKKMLLNATAKEGC